MKIDTKFNIFLCAAAIFSIPLTAHADGSGRLSGEVVMKLQGESGVDGANDDNRRHRIFLRTEVAPTLRVSENIHIDGVFVLEPVHDPDPGRDAYFKDEGIFAEEIKLTFGYGPWAAFAGKFNPAFGSVWDYGRGIWSEDFAEDYEITEKIGFGVRYTHETPDFGTHAVIASTLFADTTFLSQSVVTKRGRTDKSDGGASNPEDFSSFVVSLEGEKAAGVEDLYYKLGYRYLGEGDADRRAGGADETGWVATLGHVFRPTDRIALDVLGEYADIRDFEGVSGEDRHYASASVIATLDESWSLTVGYTVRTIDGADEHDDYLLQVSDGYDFRNGLTLEAGWKQTEESGEGDNILGALARYSFGF